jgi:hypothetical protein
MKKLTNGWLSAVCVISILALHNCCKGSLTYDGATAELKFAAREPQPVRRPQIPPCPSSRSLWRPPSHSRRKRLRHFPRATAVSDSQR